MKLAEALNIRADMQKHVVQLKERIDSNVKVQEGDQPAEQPSLLFTELQEVLTRLQVLISKINLVNTKTVIDGKTMTEMLAEKDVLKMKLEIFRSAYSNAIIKCERYSRNEVRYVSAIDCESLQKKIDTISKQYRELDLKIQEINWSTEIVIDW